MLTKQSHKSEEDIFRRRTIFPAGNRMLQAQRTEGRVMRQEWNIWVLGGDQRQARLAE